MFLHVFLRPRFFFLGFDFFPFLPLKPFPFPLPFPFAGGESGSGAHWADSWVAFWASGCLAPPLDAAPPGLAWEKYHVSFSLTVHDVSCVSSCLPCNPPAAAGASSFSSVSGSGREPAEVAPSPSTSSDAVDRGVTTPGGICLLLFFHSRPSRSFFLLSWITASSTFSNRPCGRSGRWWASGPHLPNTLSPSCSGG